jgi:ERCC4-type nuclease
MLEAYESSVVYYIIEGTFDYVEADVMLNGISKKAMISCVINTMIRDNIKVFVTKNVKETFHLIQAIYTRVQKEPEKYVKTADIDSSKAEIPVQKGRGALSKEDCYKNQLCQIPDVSLKTASAIVKKFPSFKEMLNTLSTLDDTEKLKILKEIRTEDNNGKQRRISEKVAKNIIEYIL